MDAYRRRLLLDLVGARAPLEELARAIPRLPWDPTDDERVGLSKAQVALMIERAQRGDLSVSDLTLWADLIEAREDLAFEDQEDKVIIDVIFEIANPEMNGALTHDRLSDLGQRLAT